MYTPFPRAPTLVLHSNQLRHGAAYRRWSILNRKVVKFEQTGALWRLIVIIAVPEESLFIGGLKR